MYPAKLLLISVVLTLFVASCANEPELKQASASDDNHYQQPKQTSQPPVEIIEQPENSATAQANNQQNQEFMKSLEEMNSRLEKIESKQQELLAKEQQQNSEESVEAQEEPVPFDEKLANLDDKELEGETEVTASQPANEVEAVAAASEGKFALRIITLESDEYYQKMANKILGFLEEQGVKNAKINKVRDHLVIDIEGFESIANESSKAFQEKIQEMKYQGIAQFKDAYFVNTKKKNANNL